MRISCVRVLMLGLAFWLTAHGHALSQTKTKAKPKVDLMSNIDDATRTQLAEYPEGVQSYVAYRLSGGEMKGLLNAESPEAWQPGQVGIISYPPRNLAEDKQVFKANDIVDEKNCIIQDHKIWVEGLGTGRIVDDQPVSLEGQFFVVAGNKTYRTALGGNRTIKHVVAVNTREINELLSRIAEPQGYHVWVDAQGYSLIAKFKRLSGAGVTVENVLGKSSTIPLKKLSDSDRAWAEKMAAETQPSSE